MWSLATILQNGGGGLLEDRFMQHSWAVSVPGSLLCGGPGPWVQGCVRREQISLRNPFQTHFAVTSIPPPQHPSLSSRLIARVQVPEA